MEILISIFLFALTTLVFSETLRTTAQQQKTVARRFASIAVNQDIRSIFLNKHACHCNFKDLTIPPNTGLPVNISSLNKYDSGGCDVATAIPLLQVGAPIPGAQGMSVASIQLKGLSSPSPGLATANLEVQYNVTNGMEIAATTIRDMRFITNGTASMAPTQIVNCISNAELNLPTACGPNEVCWKGRKYYFTNAAGNAVAVSIESMDENGFTALFRAASGRNALHTFTLEDGVLTAATPAGWGRTLCYVGAGPPGAWESNTWGPAAQNCGSIIRWYE